MGTPWLINVFVSIKNGQQKTLQTLLLSRKHFYPDNLQNGGKKSILFSVANILHISALLIVLSSVTRKCKQ